LGWEAKNIPAWSTQKPYKMTTQLWAIGLVILATIIGAFAPVLMKKASSKITRNIASFFNPSLIGSISLYGIGTVLFIPALKGGELSVLYPFVALTYVWVSFLSIKFLNERMNKLKWIGILLIVVGVAFIGLGK